MDATTMTGNLDDVPGVSSQHSSISQQPAPESHMRMMTEGNRLSWGGGSAPSLPSIDDDPEDDAMSIAESVKSSTMSLDPTLYHFVEENGRTYHKYKQGRYFLPNDLAEQERLGTGIWAIEFATQYPDTEVVGTDLSPIQPHYLPENCRFEIDDAEDEWTYNEPFSFIHGRALLSCFDDPSRVIQQAYENLEPGGYIELQDALFPMYWIGEPPRQSALYRWNELLMEGLRNIGRSWSNVVNYPRYFEEAGFEGITERRFYWPTSPWAKGKYFKTVAMYFQEDMISGMEAISMKVLQATGMTPTEIQDFCEEVKHDFRDTNLHAYLTVSYVYARKPLNKS
ncbi:hypothetical protein CHU98_g5919 [Xylaria longipes]|nr:hypothetical protein CHU98_g5919 [Xylaria longipes]